MKEYLLPYRWKFVAYLLILSGMVAAVFYIWFEFRIILPVFAVWSSFVDTSFFVSFSTNVADELTSLLLFGGLFLLAFCADKNEYEYLDSLRLKAFAKALLLNGALLLFSILCVYGSGFLAFLVINVFSLLIFYHLLFYLQKRNERYDHQKE